MMNGVFYGIYTQGTNRAIWLNSILLKDKQIILTDKNQYLEGETVTLTIIPDIAGTLTTLYTYFGHQPYQIITQPHYIEGTQTFLFQLPNLLPGGSYFIYYVFNSVLDVISFDVVGTEVKIIDVRLNKERYTRDDILEATLIIQSNKKLTSLIKAWIIEPMGSATLIHQTLKPLDGLDEVKIWGRINPTYSGTYRLLYGLYSPNTLTMTLAIGEKRFYVVGILNLTLDIGTTTYYNTRGPIKIRYNVSTEKKPIRLKAILNEEVKIDKEIKELFLEEELNLYVSKPGIHTITVNLGSYTQSRQFKIVDTEAPTTQIKMESGQEEGMYVRQGTGYSLQGEDLFSFVSYANLNSGEFSTYTCPIVLTEAGSQTIRYYSIDSASNKEVTRVKEVFVDNFAPVTEINFIGTYSTYEEELYARPTTKISLVGRDIGSGVKEMKIQINDEEFRDYTGTFTLSCGSYTISYCSLDRLLNKEATKTIHLYISNKITKLSITPINRPIIVGQEWSFKVDGYDGEDNLGVPEEAPIWLIEGLLGTISTEGLKATFIPYNISAGKIKVRVGEVECSREITVFSQVNNENREISSVDRKVSCMVSQADDGVLINILKVKDVVITEHSLPPGMIGINDLVYEFKALKGILTMEEIEKFNQPVMVQFKYEDEDNDGIVDNTGIIVRQLKIYKFGADGYQEIETTIDEVNKIAFGYVDSFSIYCLAGQLAGQNLSNKIYVYPNPFIKGKHQDVRFRNIPPGSIIKIYSTTGELIKELNEVNNYEVIWAGVKEVASGIYIYVVITNTGKTTGGIGVLR